jgi:hypothetical protein
MNMPVDSTATSWFPRIYSFHFCIPGNMFVSSFPRNGLDVAIILNLQELEQINGTWVYFLVKMFRVVLV